MLSEVNDNWKYWEQKNKKKSHDIDNKSSYGIFEKQTL